MSTIRVAACQIDPQIGQVDANLERISTAVTEAAGSGAQFIVLPEAAVTGYGFASLAEALPVARQAESSAEAMLAGLAQTHRATIVCGTLEAMGDEVFNVALVLTADGRRYRYRKMHLPFLGIDRFATPGPDAPAVIEADGLRFGVLICYDLRFPVWSRNRWDAATKRLNYDLMIVVANWPTIRIHAWDTLLRARAIENLSYVVGVNRIGVDGHDVEHPGHSSVISPKGDAIFTNEGDEISRTIELSAHSLQAFRDRFPAYMDADDFSIEFEAFEESDHLAGLS